MVYHKSINVYKNRHILFKNQGDDCFSLYCLCLNSKTEGFSCVNSIITEFFKDYMTEIDTRCE